MRAIFTIAAISCFFVVASSNSKGVECSEKLTGDLLSCSKKQEMLGTDKNSTDPFNAATHYLPTTLKSVKTHLQ